MNSQSLVYSLRVARGQMKLRLQSSTYCIQRKVVTPRTGLVPNKFIRISIACTIANLENVGYKLSLIGFQIIGFPFQFITLFSFLLFTPKIYGVDHYCKVYMKNHNMFLGLPNLLQLHEAETAVYSTALLH
jgi:hypothetical protein